MISTYPTYKRSDIEWMEYIPSHWDELKGQFLLRKKDCNVGDAWISTQLLSLTQRGVIKKDINSGKGKTHSDYSTYQFVENGDLIFCLFDIDETPRTVGLSSFEGMITSAYSVFEAINGNDKKYLYYFFEFVDNCKGLKPYYSGMRKTVRPTEFLKILLPKPPKTEQKAIATFLDRETQRIDSLIEEKQTFIKLLKEKRQALISHVVTKGLNPNVEMQDSGIEWIGQVPKHWGISKVRYLGQCQNGINIGGEFFGHGTPFVSYGDVYNNTSLPEKVQGLVLSTEKDRDNYSVIAGDVLFTRTSETIEEIGFSAVCKSTIEQAVFAGFLIRFRPDEGNLEVGFSEYYFRNEKLRAFFAKEMNLVTRASLSQDLLKKMPVLLPPIDEQNEIANYLQAECNKFSEIFAETEKTILLLKERRTSLISAAVTGKIDVREAM
ncbi:restriction endonuclease subunit S [Vibrio cholerae]|uniref:restriction endonuclease subunit S n=2 Tax=Vibrio cholerae TaxID=666 RepID=UPI001F086259|nr:restriction endonuclease subunit S [Vibrio cholerae]